MKKLLSLALVLCLICTTLVGCLGGRILSAEELTENIAKDPPANRTDVVAIFETWQMPPFYSSTFTPYLAAYEGRLLSHGVDTLTLARMAATDFVEHEYNTIDLTDRQAVTGALLRCYERAADTLCPPLSDPAALRAAMQADVGTHSYAAMYLVAWGFPSFVSQKMMAVETVFDSYFFEDIPSPDAMARTVADAFLAAAFPEQGEPTVSVTDRETVTDIYLTAYVTSLGDRYSIYRTADESDQFEDDRRGEYVGVGVTIQRDEQTDELRIIALNPTGPAQEVGLTVDDIIYAVDGQLVSELGYNAAVNAVRGEIGTDVTITVRRGEQLLDFTITRRALVDITVQYSISDGIGYIKITEFKANTYDQFCDAIDAMEAAGVRGVIYDLRDNPGGSLAAVTNSLAYLVPVGTRIASFSTYMSPIDSTNEHTFTPPSVVLCNENTASAGELFTSAMRDFSTPAFGVQNAVTVGTKTFGKGIMQSTFSLYDDSSITVTVAKYNPPSGVNYHGEGIIPDHIVEQTGEGDAQLDYAYELLRARQ